MKAFSVNPGVVSLSFLPNAALLETVKNRNGERFPAAVWDKTKKRWTTNKIHAKQLGADIPKRAVPPCPPELEPHQQRAWTKLFEDGTRSVAWCTGAGKSYFAAKVMHAVQGNILCVAPKLILGNLRRELEANGIQNIKTIGSTKKAEREGTGNVTLVSYDSTHKLDPDTVWDLVVADEMHYVMHETSSRTKALRELGLKLSRDAMFLGLTATPFGNTFDTVWSQLDVMLPNGVGSKAQWQNYFHTISSKDIPNVGEVRVVEGLRKDRLDEFCEYIYSFIDYVDSSEFAHLLPPTEWNVKWLDGDYRVAPANLGQWTRSAKRLSQARVDQIWHQETEENTIYITYLRETAALLSEKLGCPVVDGDLSTKKREELLADSPVIVATMQSINVGLNLGHYTNVFFVEIFPVVRYMSQVAGRFPRLRGTHRIKYTFLPMKGTADEVIYPKLQSRLAEKEEVMRSGKIESSLKELILIDPNDPGLLEELQAALFAGNFHELEGDEDIHE